MVLHNLVKSHNHVTVPCILTGFQLKRQLLCNHTNTNHVLLYSNWRIDQNVSLNMQVPDLASVILCALCKGGGKENENDVSGIIYHSLLTLL